MTIDTYGTDARFAVCRRLLKEEEARAGKRFPPFVLLPVPSTKDGRTVAGCGIPFDDVKKKAGAAITVGYGMKGEADVDLAEDELFLADNAKLTALGALAELLRESRLSPEEMTVGVIGWGRIGKELVSLLLPLGAKPVVYTTSEEKRKVLGEFGIRTERIGKDGGVCDFSGLDCLINTAPARLFEAESAKTLAGGTLVYDLASGDHLPPETRAKGLPGLPAKCFPESAGRAYFRALLRGLQTAKKDAQMPPRVGKSEVKA